MKDTRHKRPHTIPLTHETESKLLVFQGAPTPRMTRRDGLRVSQKSTGFP